MGPWNTNRGRLGYLWLNGEKQLDLTPHPPNLIWPEGSRMWLPPTFILFLKKKNLDCSYNWVSRLLPGAKNFCHECV